MSTIERADALFAQGYNCAQATFAAVGPCYGVEETACLKITAPFGGGIGRTANLCGAVSGSLMALGLVEGGITIADPERKVEVYARTRDFLDRFTQRHGSTTCRDLLGCDISTPAGATEAQARAVHRTCCAHFVHDAMEILAEMGVG